MSYTPTQWQTGDTITANKLNNIENGIKNISEPFIVTLTPTAEDFSGVMDKTVAEIQAAYDSGKKIIFHMTALGVTVDMPINYTDNDGSIYNDFGAYLIVPQMSVLVYAWTAFTNDGTQNTYNTTIYPLTTGAGGCLVVSATFNKAKTDEVGYEFFFDCDKSMEDISAAYLAGQNIRVFFYSEWAKNDSEEYIHLDTARFCKGLDVWTTYSNSADMLILLDEGNNSCFLSSITGSTTAQVEATSDYLPRVY